MTKHKSPTPAGVRLVAAMNEWGAAMWPASPDLAASARVLLPPGPTREGVTKKVLALRRRGR